MKEKIGTAYLFLNLLPARFFIRVLNSPCGKQKAPCFRREPCLN